MKFSRLSLAILAASSLLPAVVCGQTDAETELAALRAEVANLRAAVAARDTTILQLKDKTTSLESDIASVQQTVALASSDGVRGQTGVAPTSALDWNSAMKVATAARYLVKGSNLLTVMPTGSMKPVFDEHAILLTESAKYDDLKVGDIVTYKHPRYGMPVVHRIMEKRGDKFWAKGDNNGRMDEVYITRENYQGRVYGIIYANEPSSQAKLFAAARR
jgi:signal peptidase